MSSTTPGYTSTLNFGPYGNYGTMQTGGAVPASGSSGSSFEIWGPAAIGAAGQLGGALMASRAAQKGIEAQAASSEEALAFQREQEALRRANYERAFAKWMALRSALLQKYGLGPGATIGDMVR